MDGATASLDGVDLGVTFVGPRRLRGTVPAGLTPGTYDLTVTNPDGQSATLPGAYQVLNPPISIYGIVPNQGVNTAPVNLVISGAGFLPGAVASLDGVSLGVTFIDAGTLNGTVPAGLTPGLYDLTVINPDNQSATLQDAFLVLAPPPDVLSITPDWGYNDVDVGVTIGGANFMAGATASLKGVDLGATYVDASTLVGTVPSGIAPGVYDLTVTTAGGSDTLPQAYTALIRPNPNTTLESGYVVTLGSGASGTEGDDDHVQVIFLEVPDGTTGDLYVRVFDADTGGGGVAETIDIPTGLYNTTMAYTLRGGGGAYTGAGARSSHPGSGGIDSGTLLAQATVGADAAYHNTWGLVFGPFQVDAGESVGGKRVFKLAVVGNAGDDGNQYNVALSTSPTDNTAPSGSRIFAYSWTFLLTDAERPHLFPYVPAGTTSFAQHNWDMDYAGGSMTLETAVRSIDVLGRDISRDNEERSSSYSVQSGEDGTTWTLTMGFDFTAPENVAGFWAVGDGADLPIFAQVTQEPPP